MRFISEFLKMFTYITTGTAIAFAAYTLIVGYDVVAVSSVAKIPIVGIIMSLVTTATLQHDYSTNKAMILALVCHYVFVSFAMVGLGILFEWVRPVPQEIVLMLVCVAFVYVFSFIMFSIALKKEAKQINAALKERLELKKY